MNYDLIKLKREGEGKKKRLNISFQEARLQTDLSQEELLGIVKKYVKEDAQFPQSSVHV